MLSVSGLCAQRAHRTLFSKLSFTLAPGQGLHLRGANGMGKTTLLKLLAGLSRPEQGDIQWQGQTLASLGDAYSTTLHYLGHKDGLKELLSPYANLQLAAKLAGQTLSERATLQALAQVGLSHQCDLAVRSLSQGQKKRAALARLLALPRPLWLLDEPFVALDTQAQEELGGWIRQQLATGGMVIFTSHQPLPFSLSGITELDLAAHQEGLDE